MKSHYVFREELQAIVKEYPSQKLFDFIEENTGCFFSSPFISDYYNILRDIDISASVRMLPRLVIAWLAFLCGDNAGLASIMRHISELELENQRDSSFFYALKAIMGASPEHKDELKYAKLSIDVLPEGDKSIFMANAKLTYAQVLSGVDQYRTAIGLFDEAYLLFYQLDIHFPAVVALVNKLLNKYKLGKFHEVIDECNQVLIMSSSFRNEVQDYWNVVHLPLGMCYFEMNKPSLAVRHLKQSKACIDNMGLFHMHGLVELYLFKSYYLLKDQTNMEEVKASAEADFEHMHYIMTDLMLGMFRIMSAEPEQAQELQPDIERFELEYMKCREKSPLVLVETLAYLRLKGLSDTIGLKDMADSLEKLRFKGVIPYLQLFLIYMSEMLFVENRPGDAAELLKEAVSIYSEYGISSGFYILPLKSIQLLQKINQRLYNEITKKSVSDKASPATPILSPREREIMQLVAQGKGNEEISRLLFISVGTIKWHINHIFSKLEVENRFQAAEKAKSLGEL